MPAESRAPTRLVLARHGQSEWNAVGRWQGQADPGLSELGREQARRAAGALEEFAPIDAVLSSDLGRAAQTAEIIAALLGVHPVVIDARLRERDAGAFTGLTTAEIRERFPEFEHIGTAQWRPPPGWEEAARVVRRALAVLDEVADRYKGQTVLAVTHGGVIRELERHFGHDGGPIPNLAGREFVHDRHGWVLAEAVSLFGAPHEQHATKRVIE